MDRKLKGDYGMDLSYENYRKEVDEKLFEKWHLGLLYYRWEKGKIITCDDAIDKATMKPCGCKLLVNEKWYTFGKSIEDVSNKLRSTLIDPILEQYPNYTLVVLNELMEPFTITSTLDPNVYSGWGFVAGFYGGFVKNPVSKSLFERKRGI